MLMHAANETTAAKMSRARSPVRWFVCFLVWYLARAREAAIETRAQQAFDRSEKDYASRKRRLEERTTASAKNTRLGILTTESKSCSIFCVVEVVLLYFPISLRMVLPAPRTSLISLMTGRRSAIRSKACQTRDGDLLSAQRPRRRRANRTWRTRMAIVSQERTAIIVELGNYKNER
jgi:hypothetical protein